MIFFVTCIFGIIIFSKEAERTESELYFVITTLFLICVMGLRAESVGIDTKNYYREFRLISKNSPFVSVNEITFVYICKFLMKFLPEYWMLIFAFSSIIGIMIMRRLWDLRDSIHFSTAVIFFMIFHLTATMNIMRQYIGLAILFFTSRYLEKKKPVKFVIGVIIACCFHLTSIIGIAYIPIYYFCQSKTKRRYLILLFVLAAVIPLGLYVFRHYIGKYSFFFMNSGIVTMGVGFILRVLILLLFWFTYVKHKPAGSQKNFLSFLCLMDCIGIALSTLGTKFLFMDRVALPFSLFEILLYAQMFFYPTKYRIRITSKKVVSIYAIPIIVLATAAVYQRVIGNGQGVFPYVPIWGM